MKGRAVGDELVSTVQGRSPRRLRRAVRKIHRLVKASVGLLDRLKGKWRGKKKKHRGHRSHNNVGESTQSGIQALEPHFDYGERKEQMDMYLNRVDMAALKEVSWSGEQKDVEGRSQRPVRCGIEYDLDDLEVDQLLGTGVHGSVHMGRVSGETVAVKQAHGVVSPRTRASGRTWSPEEELMDEMYHPNLVEIYGVHMVDQSWGGALSSPNFYNSIGSSLFSTGGHWDENPWDIEEDRNLSRRVVVMEYCDRGNLWDAVRRGEFWTGKKHGVPNYKLIVQVAMEIVLAMEHLHDHGIIHSDLTAKNVLLSSSKTSKKFVAKVGDYGHCRRLQNDRDELTTFTFGSVDHMSPETLRDGKLHRPTDVFSFGVLLFEMITGRHPFPSMAPAAVVVAIVEGMRPKIPSTCPPDLASLIHDCWQKRWQSRPTFGDIWSRLIYAVT